MCYNLTEINKKKRAREDCENGLNVLSFYRNPENEPGKVVKTAGSWQYK